MISSPFMHIITHGCVLVEIGIEHKGVFNTDFLNNNIPYMNTTKHGCVSILVNGPYLVHLAARLF